MVSLGVLISTVLAIGGLLMVSTTTRLEKDSSCTNDFSVKHWLVVYNLTIPLSCLVLAVCSALFSNKKSDHLCVVNVWIFCFLGSVSFNLGWSIHYNIKTRKCENNPDNIENLVLASFIINWGNQIAGGILRLYSALTHKSSKASFSNTLS